MPLRVLFDARHIKDFGIGTYIRNLLSALAKVAPDHRYLLLTNSAALGEFAALPPAFETIEYPTRDVDQMDEIRFPALVSRLRPDIVHIPLNRVPFLLPRPYVVTVHDIGSLLYGKQRGLHENFRMWAQRRTLLRADKVIAVSSATMRDLEKLLGVPESRIRLIHSAPDPRFFDSAPPLDARTAGPDARDREKSRILERYQVEYPYLLYAGTIRPQKNIPRLVEAFALLRGQLESHPAFRELRLIIIGDEISQNPAVRRAVIQSHVENWVRFLGFVPFDTLRVFYECAAAFVFPSLYEGFGLPPLEAMASGAPVVTSDISPLREVVGDAAIKVNPENVFEIARGIYDVLLDDAQRNRLIQRGYAQSRQFSWERTAREVLETYEEILRQ